MQETLRSSRLGRWLAGAGLVLLTSVSAQAQLSGTKTIPGSYASLAAAITDLNAQGVGAGGVTFSVAASYTETAANLLITATGTSANPIIFQKAGSGANPLITAGAGASTTQDFIIGLAGSDYVTFNGLDVAESAANTTATTQVEFGYALFRPSATDGCQNNVIRNCVVTLNKTNANTIGIAGLAGTTTSATAVAATATTGANSGNKIYGNVVSNALIGINFAASSGTAIANYDQNNEIGSAAAGTGNTVGNFGGSASGWGAGGSYQNGLRIIGNTLNSTLNYTSATASTSVAASTVTSTLRGMYANTGTSSNLDLTGNTVTLASGATTSSLYGLESTMGSTPAGNTVNITNNTLALSYATATTGTVYGLNNSGSPATLNLTGNTISSISQAGAGTLYAIYNNHSATAANVLNNIVGNITRPGASGSVYGYYNNGSGTGTHTLTGNTFSNFTLATSGSFYGIYNTSAAAETQLYSANQIGNVTSSSTTSLYGIYCTYGASGSQVFNNSVANLSSAGTTAYGLYLANTSFTQVAAYGNVVGGLSLSGVGTVYGLYTSVTTASLYRNKVYDLSSTGSGASVIYGLYTAGGTTITAYNNLVGNLTAPASTSLGAVNGLYFSSGTTINAYYNTIYLNASSSGATFGTSGIYFSATPTTVDLRNNVVVNLSTAAGTGGYSAALRRSTGTAGTVPANYATTSNNNLFYAGTPSATNLLYVEGTTTATNAQQTLAAYKAFVANRDQAAVTENPPFASTTGSAATFLHIAAGTATQVESGGTPVSGITTDYDGDTRNASTPDIGADEGSFTPNDQTPPSITYTALGNTGSTANRTLTVTITDPSGVATGTGAPRIYYRSGTSGTYFSAGATSVSGSSYTFTINYANTGGTPAAGTTIQYYVAAQDASANSNVGTSPVGGSGTNPPGSTAPATPNSYQVLTSLSGTYYVTGTVGSSPAPTREYATLTAAVNAYNTSGLSGAVSFVLLDASYGAAETFPLVLNGNPEASATNTLTIRPGTGVSATIAGSVATGAVLKLNGADYVILDGSNNGTTSQNLTITNTSATGSGNAVLWLAAATATDGATGNVVRNLNITGNSGAGFPQFTVFVGGGGAGVAAPTTSTPAANSGNTLSNNIITKGYYGVFVFGVSATVLDQNNAITGNQIGQVAAGTGFGQEGVRVVYQQGLSLTGNEIQNISNGTTTSNLYGIFLADSKGSVVSRNSVHGLSYSGTSTTKVWAINTSISAFTTAANASANRFDNNLVYGLTSTATSATWNTTGINLGGGYGDQVVYNTVYLSGQLSAAGGTAGSAAFANGNPSVTATATNIDVRNNIFSIIGGTGGTSTTPLYAHYEYGSTVAGSTLNYNDLYATAGATGLGVVGRLNSTDYATLAAWQTATGQEANSLSVDPQFVQTTAAPYNLTPGNTALNNVGTPISGVTVDYTGATRGTTPDLGAYEFTPLTNDLAAAGLVAPATTSTCYGTAEPVSVSIRNAGTAALNFATSPATITVVVTLPGGTTQTLTTTLTTGTLASGATQTVTLPGTLDMSTVGTYSFAITATVQGDGNTSNDLLTPAPTRTVAAPVAGTLSPASSSICVSGTATLTLTGAANGSIQYQSSADGTTFTDIAGATSASYTTPVLTTTTYYRAQVRCNTGVATSNVSIITVSNPQVASTNGPLAICAGSTATLTATAATGASVRFFSAATGGTALATTTAGSYTTPALTASTTYYAEAYTGGASVAGLADNSAANGTFTQSTATDYPLGFAVTQAGTLASVDVYPTAAGTLTIRLYSVSGTQPTGTATAVAGSDVTITVTTAQVGTRVTVPLNYALAAGDYKLSNFAGGLGRFSTYSGTYPLASADGVLTVKGSYTFYYSTTYSNTTYNSFFNLTFSNECVGGAARTPIQVNVTQPGTASFPNATASTCGGTGYQLAGTVGGSATTGTYTSSGTGTFSPNATTLSATYLPSAADIAAGSVTITLSTAASGGCPAATATLALSISPAPVATFSYPAATTYCAGSASTIAPTLAGGATAGTFSSTTGLTIDAATGVITLGTSVAGTYTVTNTVAASGPCAATSATATVTITPATSAAFSYGSASYCQTGANPTPTVTGTAGGAFSSTAGLSINATTGAINLSASTVGTYTVTYTVAGACGSSATATVAITAGQVATFSYPATTTYCAGSASTITPTVTGAAGTFSSTTGLTINATTGVITLGSSTAGTYTVTNTVAASGGCAAATATATVTITPATSATFAYGSSTYCVSGTTNPAATVTGTAGGTFSSTTGLSLNATTGAITLGTSTPGTYTVTYTVAGACGSSSTQTVTITAAPLASFSYPAAGSNCAGSTGTVAATLGAGATAGTFSSTTGLTLNATTGAVNLATSVAGTYTVTNTVAAVGGCAATTATATITVNPTPATPTLTATGTSATGITLTSSAATGNQFYLNGVLIPGATAQTYLVNSGTRNGQYTVVATSAAGCSSAASNAVNVTVTATAGGQSAASLRVYPNPTPNGQVTLELSGARGATQLTVLDAVGRVVLSQQLPASTGTITHALDLSGAATGVYLLRLSSPDGVEVRRLTRE